MIYSGIIKEIHAEAEGRNI